MWNTGDTIVAISTAAGSAARAIVRLSGPRAIELAQRVFHPHSPPEGGLSALRGFTAIEGRVAFSPAGRPEATSAAIELPAWAYLFRGPRSYTRQDVVELHLPGAAAGAVALEHSLIEQGARQAHPGEFTARAFFSGRIDLSAAEAVADIIDAADGAHLRSAMRGLGGEIFHLCMGFSSRAADALALVEASIDLAEEQIAFESPAELAARLAQLASEISRTADEAAAMGETAQQPHVAIAGRPNAGKSSLLNALTGTDRSIVSALAGTTRDVLSATMELPGAAVVLQDAAGFAPPADSLGQASDDAARAAVAAADAVLFVVDISQPDHAEDLALLEEIRQANNRSPLLVVANKIDLAPADLDRRELPVIPAALCVSCKTGAGLEALKAALARALNLHAARSGSMLGLHQRQKRCLELAAKALDRAAKLLTGATQIADVAELAAIELREALAQLGQISGQVVSEEILGRIFARFCVGK